MTKKIGKGNLITELVKGSMDYTIQMLRDAFWKQFPDASGSYYIAEIFADYVIVSGWGEAWSLKADEYYKAAYSKDGDTPTFMAKDQWEIVELTYQPQSVITESKKKGGKRFEEAIEPGRIELLEAKNEAKGTRRIRINELIVANVVNGNKRLYEPEIVEAMIDDWQSHLHESAGQGRLKVLTGEADHPTDKGKKRTEYLETVVRWDKLDWDGKRLDIEGDLILTSKGRDVEILMEAGVRPGGSIRGIGESKVEKVNGQKVEKVLWLSMNGVDLVGDPSFKNVAELQESINLQGDVEMLEELKKLLAEHPELFSKGMTESELEKMGEKQLKKLEESLRNTLGLGADANIIEAVKSNADKAKKFDALQEKAGIDAAITEATKELLFGKELNEAFTESITDGKFNSADEVKTFAESQRKVFGKLAASSKLKGRGFQFDGKIQPMGSVLENETGTPEFARVAFELTESVRKHEMRAKRTLDLRAGSPAAVLTEMLLEKYDKQNMRHLIAEAKAFEEAESTSDLNLPYSVSRAVIAEAYPNLVAANIFDFGIMDQSPMNIFYEAFTGETGFSATITDEVEALGAEDTWYALAHPNIVPGTVVVTENPFVTITYVEGTDYVIDYELGKIRAIAAGAINANDVLVDYTYHATRQGENTEIERAKTTLSFQTITAAADRLADYITHEAIVFSRSQIGWDAVGRTMANLIRELRRDKDRRLIEKALAVALSVASNKTAAWDISDAVYLDFVKRIGEAKVKVVNRFYTPTSLVMSATNSDYLSNWDGFTRDGFTNAELNAAGFVGRVKGLNVWETPEMRDSFNLVLDRGILMHRIFQPMLIKGPFPTYSNGKLVAAEQYYAEEYNASLAPIGGKGSVVPTQA